MQFASMSGSGRLLRGTHEPAVITRLHFTGNNRNVIPAEAGASRASQSACAMNMEVPGSAIRGPGVTYFQGDDVLNADALYGQQVARGVFLFRSDSDDWFRISGMQGSPIKFACILSLALALAVPSQAFGESLEEAAKQAARQNKAKVLSAKTVKTNRGRQHEIKLLTDKGVVKTVRVPDNDRKKKRR